MNLTRSSGILLHLTSLPGPYGIGDLGPAAYRFADFLSRTGQRVWQILPVVPVGHGYSPYSSPSTFAGNPLLLSPDLLVEEGLLSADEPADHPAFQPEQVDYPAVIAFKLHLLQRAFDRFEGGGFDALRARFEQFTRDNADWLDDYALFMAIKEGNGGGSWTEWPADLVHRRPEALAEARARHARVVRRHQFGQFLFAEQWARLKAYCNEREVMIFGDLPIYVAHDSADVWGNQRLFHLDGDGHATVVAGVPPDYFSKTGQRWGNPLYRWDLMKEEGYGWWTRRLAALFRQVDLLRLDHFRAFEAYWEIPASEPTAVNGRWVEGPGADLFRVVAQNLGKLPIVAEDLGLITPGVRALMDELAFPGMAVLHFAFDSGAASSYLPHNYKRSLVAYTGTHDNDTTVGWWNVQKADPQSKAVPFARRYLGLDAGHDDEIHWELIRLVEASVADLSVVPLQDILGLDSRARMNTPGVGENNWAWRFREDQLTDAIADRLARLTETYGRSSRR